MTLLSDHIGTIVNCGVNSASSDGSGSSNQTGVNIQGMESILFLCIARVAGTSDGTTSVQIQYSSNSSSGSDAVTSNATMTCTDAIVTFTTAQAAGTLLPLEVNVSRKNFPDGAGYLFPSIAADSVAVIRVIAIPFPNGRTLPIAQTVATVIADD
jgi:hypothetical protein